MVFPMQRLTGETVVQRIEELFVGDAPAAIACDGDGTLWSGDVGEDFFHALVAHGDVRPEAHAALLAEAREFGVALPAGAERETEGASIARALHAAYVAGQYPEERTCEMMTWACAGWQREEITAFTRHVVAAEGVATRVHEELREVVRWARRAGILVVLVSASPREVVEAAGALVGFAPEDIVAATARYERDVMTPAALRPIPYGPGKVTGLRARLGTTKLLAAFGDNAFDVAMLREAPVAVAVRPKDRLRARASEVPGLIELVPA